jgi:hypothetical protein
MTVSESRVQLETTLMDAGLRVLPQGVAAPVSIFVAPGSPWVGPSALGGRKRTVNWLIVAVVSIGSEAGIKEAEAMAEALDSAARTLPQPWGVMTIEPPGLMRLGGAVYVAFRATIQTVI